jgi:4-amino-4-deoxy-L-arabinose transferase-like glycosyltransferase
MLASSVIRRSLWQLFLKLDYSQASPVGFLALERFAVVVFGRGELALRLVPLVSGLLSLYLFYVLGVKWLDRSAALFALGLLAIAEPFIYYSAEVKHYSTDVMCALLIYLSLTRVMRDAASLASLLVLTVTGAVAVWFSYPAAFVLAGIGAPLALFSVCRKKWAGLLRLSVVGSVWALSFVICYLVLIRQVAANPDQLWFWRSGFVPFSSLGVTAEWLRKSFMDFSQGTLRLPTALGCANVGALALLVGCYVTFRKKKQELAVIVGPVLFCLLASSLRRYPFKGRLLLFLAPGALLLMGNGAAQLAGHCRYRFLRLGGLVLVILLFMPVAYRALGLALPPYGEEEIKPVIQNIWERRQPGDIVYVHYGANPAFQYYREVYGYGFEDWVRGVFSPWDRTRYLAELKQFTGGRDVRRVWFLFSHDRYDEAGFFLSKLDGMGKRLDGFEARGAAAYLYELDGKHDRR